MKIDLNKFKQKITESLEGLAFEYQWDEARALHCKKDDLRIYLATATESISELFTEEEQEDFWELSQQERNDFVKPLGEIYDEVWTDCWNEYLEEEGYYKQYGNG
jgi:5-methylthioribose kinase